MSKSSEAVKRWRTNSKNRMVQAMGGKCQICQYNKCTDALEFHHIDPKLKELKFGGIRASPIAWAKIIVELRKCILLCSNCHKEIGCGLTLLPEQYDKFDESFVEYKELRPKKLDSQIAQR